MTDWTAIEVLEGLGVATENVASWELCRPFIMVAADAKSWKLRLEAGEALAAVGAARLASLAVNDGEAHQVPGAWYVLTQHLIGVREMCGLPEHLGYRAYDDIAKVWLGGRRERERHTGFAPPNWGSTARAISSLVEVPF